MEVGRKYVVVFDDLGRSQRKIFVLKGIKDGLCQFENVRTGKSEYIPVSRIIRAEGEGNDEQSEL